MFTVKYILKDQMTLLFLFLSHARKKFMCLILMVLKRVLKHYHVKLKGKNLNSGKIQSIKSTYYVEERFLVKPYFDQVQAKEIWGARKYYFTSHKFK